MLGGQRRCSLQILRSDPRVSFLGVYPSSYSSISMARDASADIPEQFPSRTETAHDVSSDPIKLI